MSDRPSDSQDLSADAPGDEATAAPWRDRRVWLLWGAHTTNALGDMLTFLALPMLIYAVTGSVSLLALTIFVDSVPSILLSPIAGALADRWNRERLLVWSCWLNALLTLPPVLVSDDWVVLTILVTVALKSVVNTAFRPTMMAAMPSVVQRGQLLQVNAAFGTSFQAVMFLGPLLGAALVALVDIRFLLVVDSLTFLVAGLLLARVRLPRVGTNGKESTDSPVDQSLGAWRRLGVDIRAGLGFMRRSRLLLIILGIGVVTMFGQGFITPVWLPYVVEVLGQPQEQFGVLVSIQGLGFLVGSLLVLLLGLRQRFHTLSLYAFFLITSGSAILLQISTTVFGLFLFWAGLVGLFGAGRNVVATSLVQEQVPTEMLGRVGSTLQMGRQAAHLAAVLLASLLADKGSPRTLFQLACLLWFVGCVGGAFWIIASRMTARSH